MKKLDTAVITDSLRAGGSIASRLEYFEPRQAQLDLMELIVRCFNEDAVGAAEAGTGVGKSFAYLLPAVSFADMTGERVVISTATINLQQQLFEKDIPFVQEATRTKVKAVLLKGRGNYLCFRRLEDALGEGELDGFGDKDELTRIEEWSRTSKNGGREELFPSPVESVWSKVASDSDMCMGKRCPQQDRCFIFALRRKAAAARIIVVNHHLLFADLAARREGAGYEQTAVLPPYSRVIIDEAHSVEGAATSFFSKEFGKTGILRYLTRLYRKRRVIKSGLLVRLASSFPDGEEMLNTLASSAEGIRKAVTELDGAAVELCASASDRAGGVFRFSPAKNNSGAELSLFPLFAALEKKLKSFTTITREFAGSFPEEENDNPALWELKTILRRFDTVAGICASFAEYKQRPGEVMWIERRGEAGGTPWAVFTQSPVELAQSLKESLFLPHKTVVCVSATLAINANFNFWAVRTGAALIANRLFLTGCFPSPFPYSQAVLLAAPDDAPLPDEDGYQNFVDNSVTNLAATAGGSALILFTSYQSLQSAWEAALPELESLGIRVLKQGDDDRSRLLQTFLADESSVLFATDSFWEGVDAPGDTLRLVILCRLPFRTPNDPVFEARREVVEKNGGNPFMDLSLPEAVMKFKQGFGRLIRRSGDRGVVAVLDGRLIKKRYGEYFLQALPETATSFTSFNGILHAAENFLFSQK